MFVMLTAGEGWQELLVAHDDEVEVILSRVGDSQAENNPPELDQEETRQALLEEEARALLE